MRIRDLPLNIHLRLWGSFVNRCTYSATLPFLALYLTDQVNASFAGLFLAVGVFVQFASNIWGGYFVDRMPRKKMLVFGAVLEAAALVLMWVTVLQSWLVLFLASYVLFTIFSAFRRPAMSAIVQDSATPENKKLLYRMDYWLINLSLAVGALLGGLLYTTHKEWLFFMTALAASILAGLYAKYIEETNSFIREKKHHNIFRDLLSAYSTVSRDRRFVIMVIGGMLLATVELMTSTYVAVRLHQSFAPINLMGFSINGVRMFTLINMTNTLTVVSCSLLVGKFAERFPVNRILLAGLVVYGLGYALLTAANLWWLIIVAMLIATCGEMIYAPIKSAETLTLIPKNQRGSYNTFSSFTYSGAQLLSNGSLIIGAYLNPYAMSFVVFFIVMLGSVFMMSSLFGTHYKKIPG
ncbi:MFS transporter [Macrococcus equipercicus]|uniref:MFS transporter n=1 Tax=Macrococcus equipercicus TaxID=69967 RepID=A0A9Q9BUZ7_9STAP|nr:MFS transporter [Macrococcus equipercicus]KAA1037734.1 MFS transporter [Macrococcus equipercicus]UTH13448.1 MFS transporter [Macrococcus equipercicus]